MDYREGRLEEMEKHSQEYNAYIEGVLPKVHSSWLWGLIQIPATANLRASAETYFNRFDPFTNCIVLYVICFVLMAFSWLGWRAPLARSAFWVLLLSLVVHTIGLIGRIYVTGRPPVTNLTSSAIFIAWGGVLLAAGLERVFRNGLGTLIASVVGALSLIVYVNLANDGDPNQVLVTIIGEIHIDDQRKCADD